MAQTTLKRNSEPEAPERETAAGAAGLSRRSFAQLAEYITGQLGIKMPPSKVTLLQSRLLRRVRELGMDSVEAYVEHFFAGDNEEERQHLINAITTNKTDFFREPEHFTFLRNVALPAFERSSGRGDRFKVWSAGCSTGEEPYTLAMVLADYADQRPGFDFAILATDVSTRVLDHARNAVYETTQVAPVPPALRSRYLLRNRDPRTPLARVAPELRKKVSFHQLNFMDPDYRVRDTFDAIFCRNVMIYFAPRTQEAVINRLCRNLAPGGYYFGGHSESLASLRVPLTPLKASIYRRSG
jgi:chemotaxis protein methyltransferase CheR